MCVTVCVCVCLSVFVFFKDRTTVCLCQLDAPFVEQNKIQGIKILSESQSGSIPLPVMRFVLPSTMTCARNWLKQLQKMPSIEGGNSSETAQKL